jgi:Flp pilus assembly pilin Flp
MEFMSSKRGASTVEWLVLATIIVAVVGGVLLNLFDALKVKLEAVENDL